MMKPIMRWHLSQQIKCHFPYFFHLCFLGRVFGLYKTRGAVTHLVCDGFELSQLDFYQGQQHTLPVHVPKGMRHQDGLIISTALDHCLVTQKGRFGKQD